jgi:type VI secretion system protein ImpB
MQERCLLADLQTRRKGPTFAVPPIIRGIPKERVMAKESGQKFVARNRAPRVQIEYDVELYGAEKKIQLPFVMGVLADLSGKPTDPLPPVSDRKFLEIDVDNFDSRMKAIKPRVAFQVPNTLTGEGNISVDLTFDSMDDFSPAAIARKVDSLAKLLEARQQLSNLVTYMDGKSGAEELIDKVLKDPALLKSLASTAKPSAESTAPAGGAAEGATP